MPGIDDDGVKMPCSGAVVSARGGATAQREEGNGGERFAQAGNGARGLSFINDSVFHNFVAISGSFDPSTGGEDRKAERGGNHFSLDLCGLVRG